MLKRTPLFAAHQALGARLVEFGGWEMPVQYSGIVEEHLAVRTAAGLFDISHMGEFVVSGPGAEAFLNHALTNDIRRLAVGQGQYTLLCNEQGGVVDDLYAYRVKERDYLLIVNASRIEADWEWLQARVDRSPTRNGFALRNASPDYGALAVQGPKARAFIAEAIPGGSLGGCPVGRADELKKNQEAEFVFQGVPLWVTCTGYTGEDGFEIVAPSAKVEAVWSQLLQAGRPHGLKPAGLGARDTLRTEMCYPLYGHELNEQTTPLEAGVGFFVSLDKGEFVGRDPIARQKAEGVQRKCVAFTMTGKSAPPRPHYAIWDAAPGTARLGEVASGTQSPSLGLGIGLGYVPAAFASPGTPIAIEIRGQRFPAVVSPKPLYRRPSVA